MHFVYNFIPRAPAPLVRSAFCSYLQKAFRIRVGYLRAKLRIEQTSVKFKRSRLQRW